MRVRPGALRLAATLAVLAVAADLLVTRVSGVDRSLAVLRSLRPWALAGAAAAQVASYWASGVMMRAVARAAGHRLSVGRGAAITLAAGSVGLVAGGQLGAAGATHRWMRDAGAGRAGAVLGAWMPTALNLVVIAAAAVLGAAELLALGRLTPGFERLFATCIGILSAAGAAVAWAVRHPRAATPAAAAVKAWWTRARARLLRHPPTKRAEGSAPFSADAERTWRVLRRRGAWVRPLAWAGWGITFDVASLYLLFVAARHPVGPGELLAGYGLPLLAGKLALLPGGVGVVEGSMVALYHTLGVPAPTAVTVVLAYRAVSFWLPNLVGFGLLPWLQVRRPPASAAPALDPAARRGPARAAHG